MRGALATIDRLALLILDIESTFGNIDSFDSVAHVTQRPNESASDDVLDGVERRNRGGCDAAHRQITVGCICDFVVEKKSSHGSAAVSSSAGPVHSGAGEAVYRQIETFVNIAGNLTGTQAKDLSAPARKIVGP